MNNDQIDLANTVALGSIDHVQHQALAEVLEGHDPALRAELLTEIEQTKDALSALAAVTATTPPAALRGRLLTAIANE